MSKLEVDEGPSIVAVSQGKMSQLTVNGAMYLGGLEGGNEMLKIRSD